MLVNVEFIFSVIPIECALQDEYSFPLICSGLDICWIMLERKAGLLSLWRGARLSKLGEIFLKRDFHHFGGFFSPGVSTNSEKDHQY